METELGFDRIGASIDSLVRRPRPVPLFCGVQHYAWGDCDFIPRLLGIPNAGREPFAELWIGTHPDLPAHAVIGNAKVPLDRLLEGLLRQPGRLPFLMKILAAGQPLSIQVHPDRHQAETGFIHENRLGIPLHSPRRNYRDRNHKPELLCALTTFYALKGFRPEHEIEHQLAEIPEWHGLLARFRTDGLKAIYQYLMTLPQTGVDELLAPVLARLQRQPPFPRNRREYWLLRADALYSRDGHHDRGLFSFYFLNFLCLRPGEAVFQGPGELHSYLEGVGVEIMASSNNVLRGGLTVKHVDIQALLEVVNFEGRAADILLSRQQGPEAVYPAPVEEFTLSRLELPRTGEHTSCGPVRLGIVLEGKVALAWEGGRLSFSRGQSYFIPEGFRCRFRAEEDTVIYQGACQASFTDTARPIPVP